MKDDIARQIVDARQCMGCTHEGVIITTPDGTITETTTTAERILETPLTGLKGEQIRRLCALPDAYETLLHEAQARRRSSNKSLVLVAGENKKKMVNMSVQLVGHGQESFYVHVFQDCADLRSMEERLVQSERLATIGRFASQIAHEIRNPLNSISLNVELLEDELKESTEEARGLLRTVLKELDRLNDIVTEYLQFSRFPKPQLRRARVDDVIQELARTVKLPSRVKLEVHLMTASPELWIDQRLLHQVLENLVRNGVEAIEKDGVIRIETDVVDQFLVIRVRDSGHGIPAEVREKLFQPFFTTKAHGTGLGLATSQQIIFEHNGHLLVESEPGGGSTFTALLPL